MRKTAEDGDLPSDITNFAKPGVIQRRPFGLRLVMIVVLIVLSLSLCGGTIVIILDEVQRTAQEYQEEWLEVANAFMQAMAAEEIDQAYKLFAKRTSGEMSQSNLVEMSSGPFFALFDGYRGLEIEAWHATYDSMNGTTVKIAGRVSYHDPYSGDFDFILIREEESWRILAFTLNAPPEKYNAYVSEKLVNKN